MKNRLAKEMLSGRRFTGLILVVLLVLSNFGQIYVEAAKIKSSAFFGLNGSANNNFNFASSRYGVIAPFAPSPGTDGLIPEDLDELDNHYVYVFDTKKPKSEPIAADLQNCYYPSQVYFDEKRSNVLVRGLEYRESPGIEPQIGDVLVQVGLNLENDKKPYFDNVSVTPIPIDPPTYGYDPSAPNGFFTAYDDNLILVTNGESIFVINRSEGYRYPIHFLGDQITYLGYDDSARLLLVGLSRIEEGEKGNCEYFSEIRFYELERNGVINLKVQMTGDEFSNGTGLLPGSEVVVSRSEVVSDKVSSFHAYLSASDGSLWSVDFTDTSVTGFGHRIDISKIADIPELNEGVCSMFPSARSLKYDPETRLLTIVRKGPSVRIMRPSFVRSRPKGIMRPSFVEVRGDATLVSVAFDKKGNFVSYRAFADEFVGKGALSNLLTLDGLLYLSTYDGDIFSINNRARGGPALARVGKLGQRISHISRWGEESAFVGISSFEADSEGHVSMTGSLVLVKAEDLN